MEWKSLINIPELYAKMLDSDLCGDRYIYIYIYPLYKKLTAESS